MALTTTSNRVVATGDGATTVFAFNRLLYDATHLQVYLAGVLQSSGYTVSGVPGSSTSVTFSVAPGSSVQVLLLRVVPLTQLSVYAVGGAFPAATTEKNLDLLMMANQQFDEVLDRAVTLPVTSTLTAANLPDPALAANYGKGVKIKGDGTGLDTFTINAGDIAGILTTKGDILVYSSAVDRLPVGLDNRILTARSSAGPGVAWRDQINVGAMKFEDATDPGKTVAFNLSGISAATTRTWTFQDTNDTLVGRATTDTLTNKTLTLPSISQIQFPATQVQHAGANVLDDYEEGTWTPSVGGTATYTTQVGGYIKIGKMVTAWCKLIINVIGTGSLTTISGLPFTADDTPDTGTTDAIRFTGLSQNIVYIVGFVNGSTNVLLQSMTAAGSSIATNNVLTSGTSIIFSITYRTTG